MKLETYGVSLLDKWLQDTNRLLDDSYNDNKNMKQYVSQGTVIKLDKYYVLTCYHGLVNGEYIYGYEDEIKYKLHIISKSEELDLALLEFSQKTPFLGSYVDTIFKNKISSKYDTLLLKDNALTFNDIVFRKDIYNMPMLPYITATCDNAMQGLSGSLIMDGTKCVGMLVTQTINTVNILPSYIINMFIKEFRSFSGLKTLLFKHEICNLEDDDGTKSDGLVVKNLNKIPYASKNKTLKENDIVYKINDLLIINKCINDPLIGIALPYDTYVALCDRKIKIEYYRFEANDYRLYSMIAKIKPINDYRHIKIESLPNNYYIFNGIIFTELTSDIIELYRTNNINIDGYSLHNYIHDPYNSNPSPIIIIFAIIESFLHKYEKCTELPYKKVGVNYNLAVIKNINDTKIKTIECLKKYLSPCKENNINYTFDGVNIMTIAV